MNNMENMSNNISSGSIMSINLKTPTTNIMSQRIEKQMNDKESKAN